MRAFISCWWWPCSTIFQRCIVIAILLHILLAYQACNLVCLCAWSYRFLFHNNLQRKEKLKNFSKKQMRNLFLQAMWFTYCVICRNEHLSVYLLFCTLPVAATHHPLTATQIWISAANRNWDGEHKKWTKWNASASVNINSNGNDQTASVNSNSNTIPTRKQIKW